MKQPCDENVGRALYELFKIFHEIDLNTKNSEECRPDEIVMMR
mgnify:FL=1